MIHHEVKAINGNTTSQDETKILTVSSAAKKKNSIDRYDPEVYDAMINLRVKRKYELTDEEINNSSCTKDVLNVYSLPNEISDFSGNSVAYICGYVIRKIWTKILCEPCRKALMCSDINLISKNNNENNYVNDSTNYLSYHNALKLILIKSEGKLILPSMGVYKLALATEKLFRNAINCNNGKLPVEPQFGAILCSKVLKEFITNPTNLAELFPELNSHIFDDDIDDLSGHIFSLSKLVISKYIEIRMYALSKICTRRQNGLNARHYKTREMVWMHI